MHILFFFFLVVYTSSIISIIATTDRPRIGMTSPITVPMIAEFEDVASCVCVCVCVCVWGGVGGWVSNIYTKHVYFFCRYNNIESIYVCGCLHLPSSSVVLSQSSPIKPSSHWQIKELIPSTHCPCPLQFTPAQSLMLVSQNSPV